MSSLLPLTAAVLFMTAAAAHAQDERRDILLVLGDDIGMENVSVVQDFGRV
jgi:hypothetical protein